MLSCPRDARWLLGSSRRRLGWTACRQAGWAFSGAAFCRTPSPARSPPRQVRGGGGPRHTERRWEGGRRSASPRGEGGLSRGREMSSVPPRFGYRLHRPWQLQIHVRKTRIKEAQHLGCTGHHLDTKKFLAFPEHRPCIEKLRSHRLTESTVSVQAVKSVHFKQTGSKSIWWVRELKRESGYWYPSCSVVVSLPLFLFLWETVITAATFACSLVGALSGLKAFPSPYAAGVQQAAAFQLNWRDLSDPKRSVATSDRTLPVLPSSLSFAPSVPILCHPPRPSWAQGALESPVHTLLADRQAANTSLPFIAATSHFQLLSVSFCALDSSVLWQPCFLFYIVNNNHNQLKQSISWSRLPQFFPAA